MSRNFTLTPEAEGDALAIWERVADADSNAAADRVLARTYDECEELGATPGLGHYPEELLDRRHRFWAVRSYLIVYRWEPTPVQVIAVVHGVRDLVRLFDDR